MKTIRVGGPLLGRRTSPAAIQDDPRLTQLSSHVTLEPLITPPLSQSKQEQFVILPSLHFVSVLSYKTGQRLASLVPRNKDAEVVIESVCLATFHKYEKSKSAADILNQMDDESSTASSEEADSEAHQDDGEDHVLLVGCRDGSLCEFSLQALTHPDRAENNLDCGPYQIMGPCYRPRRVFRLSDQQQPIRHVTAPRIVDQSSEAGVVVYALVETKKASSGGTAASKVIFSLLRVTLPLFDNSTPSTEPAELFKDKSRIQIKDKLKCRVGRDKKGHFEDSTPFRMVSSAKAVSKTFSSPHAVEYDIFVLVARSTSFHVYHERLGSSDDETSGPSTTKLRSVNFTVAPPNMLSALCIAPNGVDVTCGYQEGDIRVMSNLLPRVLEYMDAVKRHSSSQGGPAPKHPSKTVLVRRVHWHAHPVSTLAYHGVSDAVDPMLYSGGEESVLVTWQLSRGSYRPADVLPRLAKGGIVHICCGNGEGGASGILVYSDDNSLQLFESHNRSLLWKVQGLACSGNQLSRSGARHATLPSALLQTPLNSSSPTTLVLMGLPGAPGYLHWFDHREQRVTRQLEVAPYNRVSRTEKDEDEMPAPSITHCVFSDSGQELLTVDISPTENSFVGATKRLNSRQTVGVVSTLRFWTAKGSDAPYALAAAMTYPHGEENRVSAVAISRDGHYACTVSNDEKAFRLWHKVLSQDVDEDQRSRRTPVWVCQYKVTSPSGYSNFPTMHDAVAFSADGSILSIAYGNMITLWDYKEASLLKSLRHLDDDCSPVESLQFVKTDFLHDLILTRSSTGVRLQSPYGNRGQASWACTLPMTDNHAHVSHVELIASDNVIAICMVFPMERQSRILLVDGATGSAMTRDNDGSSHPVVWRVDGIVQAMGSSYGKAVKEITWVPAGDLGETASNKKSSSVGVFAMTNAGDMLLLQTDDGPSGEVSVRSMRDFQYGVTQIPKLSMLKRRDGKKRRREERVAAVPDEPSAKAATDFGSVLGISGDEEDWVLFFHRIFLLCLEPSHVHSLDEASRSVQEAKSSTFVFRRSRPKR